ncbi:hypothetical protein QJT78_52605, partial [Bradyrhizobium sp. Mp27]|nr:hypothetical protein [Bradyrhizobium sp. Mp27]
MSGRKSTQATVRICGASSQQQKPSPEDKVSVTKDKDAGACGLQRDLQDRLQPAHDEPVSEPVS